jgi:polysaccharide export outer membrane protein
MEIFMKSSGKQKGNFVPILLLVLAFFAGNLLAEPQESAFRGGDYRIGPKDLLDIKIYELPERNQTVRVSEDGSITLTLLGKVDVAGLTAQELEKKLGGLLDEKYTKGAHVSVFIKEYQKVSVLGAVNKPGNYELVGSTSLLQVISLAGGLTDQAMDSLYVFRRGRDGQKTKTTISIENLMNGDAGSNIDLLPNDEVIIPVEQMLTIYIYGEVKTPGAIHFKASKKISLLQAIAQAGGPTDWARKSRVVIKRKSPGTGRERNIPANLNRIESNAAADPILEDGDIVIVP